MERIQLDPWGNPYRYIAGEGLKDGFGLYNCGPDGKTSTAGNDPDDLNTWTEIDHSRLNNRALRRAALIVSGVVGALTCFALGFTWADRKRMEEEAE